jgi:23S rRNA (uridine2552-2'-O)-methyltransferase
VSGPRRSTGSWRDRQERDPFVRRARIDGYRSRAVYKLEEIDQKVKLLRPGMRVLDLGAAPGGWSQYVTDKLDGRATIVAVDLLPMDALPCVEMIEGDFREDDVLDSIRESLGGKPVDLVMSDMGPNISGNRAVDQPRSMYLAELALDVCGELLVPGGNFVCKLFQGEGTDALIADARIRFNSVRAFKPRASRASSREVYLVATGFKGQP